MLTEKDFYDYFAEETISIGFVSTHKPEEPFDLIVHPKLPQKSPFKMFFKSLKGLLCLKLRIAGPIDQPMPSASHLNSHL
jgi:hypothetical protein